MEVKIKIEDYLTEDDIQEIIKDELAGKVRKAVEEKDLDRIITNSAYRIIFKAVDEQIGEDIECLLRDKAIEAVSGLSTFHVFRQKDVWEKEDSIAYTYLQQAMRDNKDVLFERVKEIMGSIDEEYLSSRLNDLIYEVIADRILGK